MRCTTPPNETYVVEEYPVMSPIVKDTMYVREYVADIQSVEHTEIRAKVGGYLEAIHVDEGRYVKAGQLLFTISRKQYEQEVLKTNAAVASADAEIKAGEVELNNTQSLVQKNIVSNSELELAHARLEALRARKAEAEALEASARLDLSYAQIRAPFSGYLNRIPNKVGSLIEQGTLLTSISNNMEMLVYFNVSEKEYLDYVTSADGPQLNEVKLQLANGQFYPLAGKVETVETEIERSTGSVAFRARFPNPNQLLKHGSSGKILVATELQQAMLVPQKSTFEIQENLYVFVVGEDSRVAMRKIIPSVFLSRYYVISSGLLPTDRFIFEGVQRVRPGDTIKVSNSVR
ncbi:MAG: efflux RND transporter periplasmic adaptor subunit [Cyclobacteriaceae bacterium]